MFDISLLWASFVMFKFFSCNYNGIGFSIWVLSLVEGPTAPSLAAEVRTDKKKYNLYLTYLCDGHHL